MLERVQRTLALRVTNAYRTASKKTLQVVAGIIPIWLLVDERRRLHMLGRATEPDIKRRKRAFTLNRWQEEWTEDKTAAQWTRRLIPDIRGWVNYHFRSTDYQLTQFFTGHGSFRNYTHRIGKSDNATCLCCNGVDTVEHRILICPRWTKTKRAAELDLEMALNADNIVGLMITNRRQWAIISNMIRAIMRLKESEERLSQRGRLEGVLEDV